MKKSKKNVHQLPKPRSGTGAPRTPKVASLDIAARQLVIQVEPPLLVFVSSAIRGMEAERETVEKAVSSLQLTRPWRFETAPASSQDVTESYLSKVRESDLFVLLVGDRDAQAVRDEYLTAVQSNRPVLAFVRSAPRAPDFEAFVEALQSKYAKYSGLDELYSLVRASTADEVIKRYRSTLRPADTERLVEALHLPAPKGQITDVLRYTVFGFEAGSPLRTLFEMFGAKPLGEPTAELESSVEEIHFSDLAEMNDVFAALTKVMAEAQTMDGDRQTAFERALKNEAISRASRYVLGRLVPSKPSPSGFQASGLKYLIWGVHRDYAPIIRLIRIREVAQGVAPMVRDADEVIFDDTTKLQTMVGAFAQSQKDSSGNPAKLLELLLAAAMRQRLQDSGAF